MAVFLRGLRGGEIEEDGGAGFLRHGAVEAEIGNFGLGEDGGDEVEEGGELGEDDGFGAGMAQAEGFEVGDEGGDFGGRGGADAAEGDALGFRGLTWLGGAVEILVIIILVVVTDHFEDVALIDGFSAVET